MQNGFQILSIGILCSILANSCVQRNVNTESEFAQSPLQRDGIPLMSWLSTNSKESREWTAIHLEKQLKVLLDSANKQDQSLREMSFETIRALREGGDKICDDSAKLTVYRGHGFGLIPPTKDGKKYIVGNYFTKDLGRFSGIDWEVQAQKKFGTQSVNFDEALTTYSGAGIKCEQGDSDLPVGKYDYFALAKRHSLWCINSPFISTSASAAIAKNFKSPVIEARVCPGRLYPTSHQPFGTEIEFLVFGFLLPEEIVTIHHADMAATYRLGVGDNVKKEQAQKKELTLTQSAVNEQKNIIGCSISEIAFQNNPAISRWLEKKFNTLTDDLSAGLRSRREKNTPFNQNWITEFPTKCSCQTYVNEKRAQNKKDKPGQDPDLGLKGSTTCF